MNKNRRKVVKIMGSGLVAIPALGFTGLTRVLAAGDAKLSPDDPAAKNLNYTEASTDSARHCAGCQFYSGVQGDDWGPCVIFPEKLVNAGGLCNSWYARAG
ncbi:MAG: high-potential iron sulfur protein 2 [Gammaproteobacteria bacterium]|nr:high-potential iron sulfur protein 2 [Gammaproteobacteria bacterium]